MITFENSRDSAEPSSVVDFLYGNGYLGTYLVRVCSYNVNCKFNKKQMYDKWLSAGKVVDVMAIGFQELYFNLKDIVAPDSIFNNKQAITPHKRWIEFFQSLHFIKDNYNLLLSKSFAGLCLIIFVRKSKHKKIGTHVSNVLVGTVPVGMLGMANKGALAISFRIGEFTLCFINCHLPAGGENFEKRQFSLQAVIQKLQLFQCNKSRSKKISFMEAEMDVVFLFGDLNFRLQKLTSTKVINRITKLKNKVINELLQLDELIIMKESDILYNSLHEGQINFLPTYKFFIDSNRYETKRVPSYCDRILWMGSSCLNISYGSYPEFTFSDHKPISAEFLIDSRRLKKRKSEIFHKVSQSPLIRIDSTVIEFGDVYFMKHNIYEKTITNFGKTSGEIIFKNIEASKEMPTWFTVIPSAFNLEPKESKVVQFRVYIDCNHVASFNRNAVQFNCQLICFSVTNGMDTPLTFNGNYHINVFGIHLEVLKCLDQPIDHYKPKDILKLEKSRKTSINPLQQHDLLDRILITLMPNIQIKESFVDIILQETFNMNDILKLIQQVNDLVPLNLQPSLSEMPYSISTYVETLLIFTRSLPQPIIPFVVQARLTSPNSDKHHFLKVLHNLPRSNIIFLRRMFRYFHDFIEKQDDAELIASLIVSCIPPSNPNLKDPLTTIISLLLQKPHML